MATAVQERRRTIRTRMGQDGSISAIPKDFDKGGREARLPGVSDNLGDRRGADLLDMVIASWGCKRHAESAAHMEDWHRLWDKTTRIFSGETLRTAFFNVSIPIVRKGIEGLKNRQMAALWPDEQFFKYVPLTADGADAANQMTLYVRHALRDGGVEMELSDEFLIDYNVKGTGITETVWEEKVGRRVVRDKSMEFDEETGSIRQIEREGRGTYLIHSRPSIRRVNLRNFYPARAWGVTKLEELPLFSITRSATWAQLYGQRERLEVEVDVGGFGADRLVGRFQNTPRRDEAGKVPVSGNKAGSDTPEIEQIGHSEWSERVNGFRVLELWVNGLDLEGILRERDGDVTADAGDVKDWIDRWGLFDEDLAPDGGWWRLTILPDLNRLIEVTRNPFPEDRLPFMLDSPFSRGDCLFGIGYIEYLWSLQRTMNLVMSNAADAIERITDPMYAGVLSRMSNRSGSFQEILNWEPGRIIEVKDGPAGAGGLLSPIHPDVNLVNYAINFLEWSRKLIFDLMGIPPEVGGIAGDRATATEVRQIAGSANQLLVSQVKSIRAKVLAPHLDQIWMLTQECLTRPEAILAMGSKGELMPLVVDPSMMKSAELRAVPLGSTEMGDRTVQAQVLMNILLQAKNLAPQGSVDFLEGFRKVLRLYDLGIDLEDLFPEDEEVAQHQVDQMALMQGSGALAALGGQGGGGAGPGPVVADQGDLQRSSVGGAAA